MVAATKRLSETTALSVTGMLANAVDELLLSERDRD
jgi:hypothetical protein